MPHADLRDTTIVFDLDGTLVDTAPDLTNALNDALIRRGTTQFHKRPSARRSALAPG